ncbi:hypothetical protein BH09PLA1_BH09PLA1_35050 [soil metagenome]
MFRTLDVVPASHPNSFMPESLEQRVLLSATIRSIDGSGNNLANPHWGAVGGMLTRMKAAEYGANSSPAGATRESARAISNAVAAA